MLYGNIFNKYLKDKENLFVISSDFCHWGIDFDYMFLKNPKTKDVNKEIENMDKEGIGYILGIKLEELNQYFNDTDNTICGKHPIKILMEMFKNGEN